MQIFFVNLLKHQIEICIYVIYQQRYRVATNFLMSHCFVLGGWVDFFQMLNNLCSYFGTLQTLATVPYLSEI